ncbi:MAG: NYN domain-containing protein, partial [Patescibacteria group bacterium]
GLAPSAVSSMPESIRRPPTNYAFIDSQNLNLAIRDQGWVLDFVRFQKYLKEKYHISKSFLFIGFIPKNQVLYTFLHEAGYILIFKPCMQLPSGSVKGNVDAELVLHTMIEYSNYDQALLVTGDGDFACLVQYLAQQKKLLRLLIPNATKYSGLLKAVGSGKIDFMNNLQKKLAKTQRGPIAQG